MRISADDFTGEPRYEFTGVTKSDRPSHKFWVGKCFYNSQPTNPEKHWCVAVLFGRVESVGQIRYTWFDTEEDALEHLKTKTEEKLKKGYKRV